MEANNLYGSDFGSCNAAIALMRTVCEIEIYAVTDLRPRSGLLALWSAEWKPTTSIAVIFESCNASIALMHTAWEPEIYAVTDLGPRSGVVALLFTGWRPTSAALAWDLAMHLLR